MFIDEVEIKVMSGKGGNEVVHFRREKYVPMGGPDGGDGGKGGDVVLVVVPTLNTLASFRHQSQFKAQKGANGGPSNRTGRSGEDVLIKVPPGTLVFDASSEELLADLMEPDQRLVICKGGRAGRGNARFANARNQAPRIAEKGAPAEEKKLRLELKLIADIGIVGVPNAGKSTFLSAVTNAKPKIAPYPFTTLVPNLGVAELDLNTTLVLADIPGLIEGAHAGAGLGDAFLRHIQRTRVLIHLLDGMGEDPLADYAQINTELALFDPDLAEKPQLVALNKMDLPDVSERWPDVKVQLEARGIPVVAISAVAGTEVRTLLYQAHERLQEAPPIPKPTELPVYRVAADPGQFEITRMPEGWEVKGQSIERAAAMTYWEYDQSVRRFQKILQLLGIEAALREAGIKVGDMVFVGEFELEWTD